MSTLHLDRNLRKYPCNRIAPLCEGLVAVEFAQWLQRQLTRREWSQADFAKRLETSTGSVSMWLKGKRVPDPLSVDKIADALGMDFDYVMTMVGHRPSVEPLDDNPIRDDLVAKVQRVRLTDDRIYTLETIINGYIDRDRRDTEDRRDRVEE